MLLRETDKNRSAQRETAPCPRFISRTIRLDAALFERIMEESEKTGVSFNKIVNQCITYAFQHYREPKVTPDGR